MAAKSNNILLLLYYCVVLATEQDFHKTFSAPTLSTWKTPLTQRSNGFLGNL